MQNSLFRKGWVVAIIVLFVCMSVIPSSGITSKNSESLEINKENEILGNRPPYVPSNPIPKNGETDVPINGVLDWDGGETDGVFSSVFATDDFITVVVLGGSEGDEKTDIILPENNSFYRSGDIINITGNVYGLNFQNYKIQYGEGKSPTSWSTEGITLIDGGFNPVIVDTMATWDTSFIDSHNYYTLKLIANFSTYENIDTVNLVFHIDMQVGWPQKVNYRIVAASAGVEDVNKDGFSEIFTGECRNGYSDMSFYGWSYDGGNLSDWPKQNVASYILSAPALADVDGDGDLEIFVGTGSNKVEAWHHNGSTLQGWPANDPSGEITGAITISDIDNDGDLEIIAGSLDHCLYAWHHDGSLCSGFPVSTGNRIIGSAGVADLDEDGDFEIVVGSQDKKVYVWHHNGSLVSGWPKTTADCMVTSSPSLGDIDGDGDIEIIIGSYRGGWPDGGRVYAWHHNGSLVNGWPITTKNIVCGNPALGDIDSDGDLEIFAGSDRLYAWHHNGTNVTGWPQDVSGGTNLVSLCTIASPVIGDIDGDDNMEILISTEVESDKFWGFHHDGTKISGWPKILHTANVSYPYKAKWATPVLADIDNDDDLEVILGDENYLYVWDLNKTYNSNNIEWGMFQHDMWHTGWYEFNFPVAKFAYSIENKTVLFDASASFDRDGTIVTWLWNFGDGVEGTGKIVEHTYSEGGDYLVTLTVIDDDGYNDKITIFIIVGENQPPETPDIDGPTNGNAGTSYSYTVTSTDPDGDDVVYCFDWGDGSGQICVGPFASGEVVVVNHTFDVKGSYTIEVKASDVFGAESEPTFLSVKIPRYRIQAINKQQIYHPQQNIKTITSSFFCPIYDT